jgi:hypothetical protein
MPLFSSLTTEDATLLLAIFTPLAAALFWLGVTHNKLSTLKTDVKDLTKKVNDVTIKLEAYLLARDYIDRYFRKE